MSSLISSKDHVAGKFMNYKEILHST